MFKRKAALLALGAVAALVAAFAVWGHFYESRVNWLVDTEEGMYQAMIEHHTPILESGKLPPLTQQLLGLQTDDLPDGIRFGMLCDRANAHARLAQWGSAEADFIGAVALNPKRAARLGRLHDVALLCWYRGQRGRALAMYDRLLAASPGVAEAHVRIAEFLATQEGIEHEPALALTHARRACEIENSRRCLDVLAKAYALAERYDDAVKEQERALLVGCDGPQVTHTGYSTHYSDELTKERLALYKDRKRVRKNYFRF